MTAGGAAVLYFREGPPLSPPRRLGRFDADEAAWLAALSLAVVARDLSERLDTSLDPEMLEFYHAGLKSFPAVPPQDAVERARVVDAAIQSPDELARRFVEQAADDVMRLFYTSPEGFAAIGYGGPPQPRGFPGYEAPP